MSKTLYRSPDSKFLGVCGGLADYFNIDPTLVRIGVALAAIYTALIPVTLVYVIIALIIPKAPENYYQLYNNTARRLTKGHNITLAGVCSGVAERLDIDVTIVRIIFVFLVLALGVGVFGYIACAIIMPSPVDDEYNYNYNQNYYGENSQNGYYNNPEQNSYGEPPYGTQNNNQPPQNN